MWPNPQKTADLVTFTENFTKNLNKALSNSDFKLSQIILLKELCLTENQNIDNLEHPFLAHKSGSSFWNDEVYFV